MSKKQIYYKEDIVSTNEYCNMLIWARENCKEKHITEYEIIVGSFDMSNQYIENVISDIKIHEVLASETTIINCGLTSLKYVPYSNSALYVTNNCISSLRNVHKHIRCTEIFLNGNKFTEGGIGLLLIDNLSHIEHIEWTVGQSLVDPVKEHDSYRAIRIIKSYLSKGKAGLLECQEELIEAGLSEYAKL